jgi:hypothetical protein
MSTNLPSASAFTTPRFASPRLAARPSPLTTHHSPLTTHRHSPLTTHPSPLTTHHSPLTHRHSPLTTHHSPLATHHSPLTTHHSPTHASPCVQVFKEGESIFDDPNLKVAWQVTTYWKGNRLCTSEFTPDGKYNGGRPIVCSRWIDANEIFISRFDFGGSKPHFAYCERMD